MMPFKVTVWCSECCGEDPLGCFDGGYDTWDEYFETREEAENSAYEYTLNTRMKYEITEETP